MLDLADLLNASLVGRYAIRRELGTGGWATVFLAQDLKHPRPVAIKVLHPELAAVLGSERFLREIEIAAGLNHPHILPLYDSGAAAELLYYVMPYAEGESLRQRLAREKQLPVADARRIAREVADALDYAHRRGVVHRDIKPENILFQEQHAVVADFGIARAVVAAGGEELTTTGVVIGTPAYMSPEQAAGSHDLDGRSDIYALGCVLYEMLAGQPPFTGGSLTHQHLNVRPRPVTDLRPTAPVDITRAIECALAKTPADRFKSASEFAAAIVGGEESRATTLVAPAPAGRRRMVVAAVSAVAILVVALAAWWWWGRAPDPAKKAWILVAEFEGPAADSALVAATRDLVTAALDQSEIVATVPREQIRLALKSAEKPTSTRVDVEVAREIAYRSAVRTVLEGRVGRLGSGYSIVLRVLDADSARVLVSVSDVAGNEQSLIPTVGRITKKLRAELGERQSALHETTDLFMSITPSFEAYRAWARGRAHLFAMENRPAITWYRAALALDPDYGSAWTGIGYAFGNLREPDSSLVAFREAAARPHRLPANGLWVATQIAYLSGDLAGTLARSERLVQLNPQSWTAHNNRSAYLASAGRLSEALECARTAEKVSPFGASQQVLGNQFGALLSLGRVDEAGPLVPRLTGPKALEAPMQVAAAAGQWSAAESLATELRSAPAADDDLRLTAASVLAAAQSSRGQVRAAEQTLLQAQSEAETAGHTIRVNQIRWMRLALTLYSRGIAAGPGEPGGWDGGATGRMTRGHWAAATGDTTLARQVLTAVRKGPTPELSWQGFAPALLQARIAARAGRWEDVPRDLGPAALQGEAYGYILLQSAPMVRWMVAEAYERLNRPDSAAAYFERAIARQPDGGTDFTHSRMALSFGHRRLIMLYARMGRLEEARQHWESLSATFTRPDPDMTPLVEEARAALASAEAIARTARR